MGPLLSASRGVCPIWGGGFIEDIFIITISVVIDFPRAAGSITAKRMPLKRLAWGVGDRVA